VGASKKRRLSLILLHTDELFGGFIDSYNGNKISVIARREAPKQSEDIY